MSQVAIMVDTGTAELLDKLCALRGRNDRDHVGNEVLHAALLETVGMAQRVTRAKRASENGGSNAS